MNRRKLFLAAAAAIVALATACADATGPKNQTAIPRANADLVCQVSAGSQVCTGT